jgi:hypothetical protein
MNLLVSCVGQSYAPSDTAARVISPGATDTVAGATSSPGYTLEPAYPGPTETVGDATPYADGEVPRTYRNESGYAVDVPAGWYVWDGGIAMLTSYDMDAVEGSGGVPPHLTKIDIWVDDSDRDSALADVVDERLADEGGMCGPSDEDDVLLREEWTLEDGTPAIRFQLLNCDSWESAHLVARIGGKLVHLVGFGGLERFDEVARSLRATQ